MSAERLAYAHEESSSVVVQALCRGLAADGVNLDIHADDEMYHFFLHALGYPPEQAAAAYFDSGARIWGTLRQVIAWRFGAPRACRRLLDFASGYGRVARHIAAELPREAVWVSDIYAEGVAFQERHLGVRGIVSVADPERFAPGGEFDCIVVSSLFTHLPAPRFAGWLRRLGAALAPGGMLLWSVHDLALRRGGPPAASGLVFEPRSESGSLAAEEYGTTWVSEDHVRTAAGAAVPGCAVHRIPRALGNFQDLYVLLPPDGAGGGAGTGGAGAGDGAGGEEEGSCPEAGRGGLSAAPGPLAGPRVTRSPFEGLRVERSPDGSVEECRSSGGRGLLLSGWVGDRLTGLPPREVRATIDGAPSGVCRDLAPRAAVERTADPGASDPIAAFSWRLLLQPAAGRAFADGARLRLGVLTGGGEELELYADTVAGALLRSAWLDLHATQLQVREEARRREAQAAELGRRIERLERQVGAMEASRFWKLRNRWFRFKRWARLTAEP